jgi:hypothetical protein
VCGVPWPDHTWEELEQCLAAVEDSRTESDDLFPENSETLPLFRGVSGVDGPTLREVLGPPPRW